MKRHIQASENKEEDRVLKKKRERKKGSVRGKAETRRAGGPFPRFQLYLITQVGVSSVDQ